MDINEIKKGLLNSIETSTLSVEDKKLWSGLLESAPEEITIAMHSFFIDYEGKLPEATEILKGKINAIKNQDTKAWNNILKNEESFIKEN